MNQRQTVLTVVLLVVVLSGAVAYYAYDNQDLDDKSALTGDWILTETYGVYDDGTFDMYTAEDLGGNYDLTVTGVKNDMFYGTYEGEAIAGMFTGGELFFQYIINDEVVIFDGFMIDDNTLYVRDLYVYEDETTSAYFTIYTKDGVMGDVPTFESLEGKEWTMDTGASLVYGTETDLTDFSIQKIGIVSQSRGVFYGYMDKIVTETTVQRVSIKGSIDSNVGTTGLYASVIDDDGHYWNFCFNEDYTKVIATNVQYDDVGPSSTILVCSETVNDISGAVLSGIELEGTTWKNESTFRMNEDGEREYVDIDYQMTFYKQYGSLVSGYMYYGNVSNYFSMCVFSEYNSDLILFDTMSYLDDYGVFFGYGWFTDEDTFDYVVMYVDADGKKVAEHSVFSKEYSSIVGTWKYTKSFDADYDGSVYESDSSMYDNGSYDLTVLGCDLNGKFHGIFLGEEIVGSYSEGYVYFDLSLDNVDIHFEGSVIDDNTMIVQDLYYYNDGGTYASTSVFTKDGDASEVNMDFCDLSDHEWALVYGNSLREETVRDLAEGGNNQKFIIIKQVGGAFTATMDQYVGNEIVSVDVYGSLWPADKGDTCFTGLMIDTNGAIWVMNVDLELHNVTLKSVMQSVISGQVGATTVVERVYSNNNVIRAPASIDLEGTQWFSTTAYLMDENGVQTTNDIQYTISFTKQSNTMVSGIGIYNGTVGAEYLSLSVYSSGYTFVDLSSQYGEELYPGYGWFNEDYTELYTYVFYEMDGVKFVEQRTLTNVTFVEDIIGTWYLTSSDGVDHEGNFVHSDSTMYADLYNLQIKSMNDGLFTGTYAGADIVGLYTNGMLYVQTMINGEHVYLGGIVLDEDTMIIQDTYCDASGNTSIYTTTYTKSKTSVDFDVPSMVGSSWKLVYGKSLYGDNVADLLAYGEDQKLTIVSQDGFAFVGTMDQVVGDSVVTLNIKGSLYPETIGAEGTIAKIIDENGNVWDVAFYKSGDIQFALMSTVMISDVDAILEDWIAVFRCYINPDAEIYFGAEDYKGTTWHAVSSYELNEDGSLSKITNEYGLIFTGQESYMLSGVIEKDGVSYGNITAALNYSMRPLYYPTLNFVIETLDETFVGYAWFEKSLDTTILHVAQFSLVEDERTVQITEYEKVLG